MIFRSLLFLGGLFLSISTMAESRYISDIQYIPIRSGAGNQFRIVHKGLKSGLKLTVIEAPEDSEWTKIATPSGIEGWIRNQYIDKEPTAQIKLDETQEKWMKSTKRVAELETTLKQLKSDHSSLSTDSSKTNKELEELSEKYKQLKSLSADAVSLSHRYEELLTKHEMFKTEFDTIKAENDRLKSEKTINQWLFGAGLIILGMILMIILPALKPQKSNSDWAN